MKYYYIPKEELEYINTDQKKYLDISDELLQAEDCRREYSMIFSNLRQHLGCFCTFVNEQYKNLKQKDNFKYFKERSTINSLELTKDWEFLNIDYIDFKQVSKKPIGLMCERDAIYLKYIDKFYARFPNLIKEIEIDWKGDKVTKKILKKPIKLTFNNGLYAHLLGRNTDDYGDPTPTEFIDFTFLVQILTKCRYEHTFAYATRYKFRIINFGLEV